MIDLPKNKALILFDGVCNLCNASVRFVIKKDKKEVFLFAPLQSNIGQQISAEYKIDTANVDSILLYIPGQGLSIRSTAALKILSKLGFAWNLCAVFLVVPGFIRNWFYDFIAKNRYRWFGKKETCMVPTKELKDRFLD